LNPVNHVLRTAWPAVALTLIVMFVADIYGTPLAGTGTDGRYYRAMALAPMDASPETRTVPYCWRILTPLVVRATRLPTDHGFKIITFVTVALTPIALVWFLQGLGISGYSQRGAALLFGLTGPAGVYLSKDFVLVDGPAFFLLVLACACAVHKRAVAFLVTLLLLAATKEIAVLAAVFGVLWAWQQRDRRQFIVASLGAVLVAAVLLALRLTIHPLIFYGYVDHVRELYWPVSLRNVARRLLLATGSTWNIVLPIAALQLFDRPRVWRSPAFLIPTVIATAQIGIALMTERIVVNAFPFVFAALAWEIDWLASGIPAKLIGLWAVVLVAQLPWVLHFGGLGEVPHIRAVEIALVAATATLLLWRASRIDSDEEFRNGHDKVWLQSGRRG
jgi:hypothetical protein